ncbi:hypothetical protein A2Y85_07275 [candidate division WOR-3 bacterium RBG_13_43_14]|uniref:4Fe-4S ferredoxin-type domain-containing protein n=1 Tax=candidate division WOR-3 bacterium RBG_13_43_14 TaxID=1802590 RepID=A0A1F4U2Z2_UNCW3|nr:MAG: hypothetical protein A2Y85_07275 [candidate division WOR-3 bacterium RBG_13_43_14]
MKKELENYSILNKEDFNKFFNTLLGKYNIFGPSKSDKGDKLNKINSADDLMLDYKNFKMSAKEFFFPQCETLLAFDPSTGIVKNRSEDVDAKNDIIFGIRPCDALALSFFDRVFKDGAPQDPYYTEKRHRSTIISLACLEPEPTCFCNAVGCDVDSETGADIILTQLNSRYLIKSVTEKGIEILKHLKTLIPATEDDIKEKDELMAKAKSGLKSNVEVKALKKKLDDFDASFWQTVHQKCLGCGVCTYFCPTCHCFDMTDEVCNNTGRRIRTWDSCMFPLFTLHASGHNPRPSYKERMRQRILHKFNYAQENYNEIFCVGCGRCIINCPVNLDIRKVIQEILEAK